MLANHRGRLFYDSMKENNSQIERIIMTRLHFFSIIFKNLLLIWRKVFLKKKVDISPCFASFALRKMKESCIVVLKIS